MARLGDRSDPNQGPRHERTTVLTSHSAAHLHRLRRGRHAADSRVASHDVVVERWEREPLLERVADHLGASEPSTAVAIGSVNLDHFTHFGRGRIHLPNDPQVTGVDWVMLADGAPVAYRATMATGRQWPRLTGADLLPDLLRCTRDKGRSVGFLGGTSQVHDSLREVIDTDFEGLDAQFWSPGREEIDSAAGSARIAAEIRERGIDVLTVALGKPRQELWIQRYGRLTGARVLLAFGASTDFLAGKVERAPRWMQDHGLEWAYRLRQEPRRLARRYLVEGPPALGRIARAREL